MPAICADEDARSPEIREALDYAVQLNHDLKPFARRFWKALGEGDPLTRPQIVGDALKAIRSRIEPITRHWDQS